MGLELKIQNFGPIDEATIQVGRFTVFAGPNNTGKTFVAKMLYSVLGAINANHALVFFEVHASMIYRVLEAVLKLIPDVTHVRRFVMLSVAEASFPPELVRDSSTPLRSAQNDSAIEHS